MKRFLVFLFSFISLSVPARILMWADRHDYKWEDFGAAKQSDFLLFSVIGVILICLGLTLRFKKKEV